MGLTPFIPEGATVVVISFPLVNCHLRGVSPDQNMYLPLLLLSIWFLIYILSCINSVQLVFRLFSVKLTLHSVVVLLCLQ